MQYIKGLDLIVPRSAEGSVGGVVETITESEKKRVDTILERMSVDEEMPFAVYRNLTSVGEICGEELQLQLLEWAQSLSEKSSNTFTAYVGDVCQFLRYIYNSCGQILTFNNLGCLDHDVFQTWIQAQTSEGVNPTTVNRRHSSLRHFFGFILSESEYQKHPVALTASLETQQKPPVFLSYAQVHKLFKELDLLATGQKQIGGTKRWVLQRDRALIGFLYGSGLQVGEALSLGNMDIDSVLESRMLQVKNHGGGERILPIKDAQIGYVREYIEARPTYFNNEGSFFRAIGGGTLSPREIQKRLGFLRDTLALPSDTTPHTLRHSFAVHQLIQNVNAKTLQTLLGLKSTVMISKYRLLADRELSKI